MLRRTKLMRAAGACWCRAGSLEAPSREGGLARAPALMLLRPAAQWRADWPPDSGKGVRLAVPRLRRGGCSRGAFFCLLQEQSMVHREGLMSDERRQFIKGSAALAAGSAHQHRRLGRRLGRAREEGSAHRLHSADRLRVGGDGLGAEVRREVRHQDHPHQGSLAGPACATSWSTASSTWRTCSTAWSTACTWASAGRRRTWPC